jgi:DNA ligase (NAD+)
MTNNMTKVDTSLSLEDRKKFMQYCADKYETDGTSPISDKEYDVEMESLKLLLPSDPFFSKVGGMDEEHVYGASFAHKYVMGSLFKDPNPEEFEKWFGKTYPNTHDLIAVLQYKIDGSSLCLHYQDGELIRVVTRGDGITGIDVTTNAKHVKGVLKKIDAKGYVEIKGECYKDKQDFYKNWAGEFANPRNFVAGSLNAKDEMITKKRGLSFIAYEIRGMDFETETKKVLFLDEMGFETLKNSMARIKCRDRSAADVARAVKNYMDKTNRDNLPFDIDGVVFKPNDIKIIEEMGETNKRPKACRAIKFMTDQKTTILEGIEWSMGRTGSLTPVGLLKPVQLAGTTVKRVSLHNLKELKRLNITHYGCEVLVEKAGDIIPKVIKKTKPGPETDKIKASKYCPMCKTEMQWDNTKTTVWCHNDTCPAKVTKSIDHWLKKLGVKGIGESIAEKLMDEGYVKCISDMYKLRECNQDNLKNSFGTKAYGNILEALNSVKEISLSRLIEALGIGKVGRTASDITTAYPTIKEIDSLSAEDLVKIDGFSDIKAESFLSGWKSMRKEIDIILKYIDIVESKKDSNKLSGKSFCVTGTLTKGRKEVAADIESNGGIVKGSVGKGLDYLIAGDDAGSKKEKAEKLGISVISEDEFLDMLR